MAIIKRMDHFTIVTDRPDDTEAFYARLGLTAGPRPAFPAPGLWLYCGDQAVLHIVEVATMPEPRRGAIDHLAFASAGLAGVLASLEADGLDYRLSRVPEPFGNWQIFIKDPNGVDVELNFPADEPAPPGWPPPGASGASGASGV
ncbi:MAG: dioxygenase [Alphaproteobacteria bacterium]|nr:MAG: dioxygenase [Alphaproteobacteria bacterium]